MRSKLLSILLIALAPAAIAADSTPSPAETVMTESTADQLWKQLSADERAVSEQFKKNGNRREAWTVLEKKLAKGVPSAFAEKLLGKPESVQDDGSVWLYTLYYSSFLRLEFDKQMTLKKVTAK